MAVMHVSNRGDAARRAEHTPCMQARRARRDAVHVSQPAGDRKKVRDKKRQDLTPERAFAREVAFREATPYPAFYPSLKASRGDGIRAGDKERRSPARGAYSLYVSTPGEEKRSIQPEDLADHFFHGGHI